MINIYCITDINNNNYVGSTKLNINQRFQQHKYNKSKNRNTSSKKLDLDNSNIRLIETCEDCNRTEREKYWINNIDTINEKKLNGRNPLWREQNKDKLQMWNKKYCRLDYQKHKKARLEQQHKHYIYTSSWGGNRRTQNNLLLIDVNLFI